MSPRRATLGSNSATPLLWVAQVARDVPAKGTWPKKGAPPRIPPAMIAAVMVTGSPIELAAAKAGQLDMSDDCATALIVRLDAP